MSISSGRTRPNGHGGARSAHYIGRAAAWAATIESIAHALACADRRREPRRAVAAAMTVRGEPPDEGCARLDDRRGLEAQRETVARRAARGAAADQATIRNRTAAFERELGRAPAASWAEAAEKARYLLGLFAASPDCRDPRRQKLVRSVLADFERLGR
jgi:hypothetical protein